MFEHWDDDDDDSEDAGGVGPAADEAPRINRGGSGETCESRRLNKVKRKNTFLASRSLSPGMHSRMGLLGPGPAAQRSGSLVRLGPHTCM